MFGNYEIFSKKKQQNFIILGFLVGKDRQKSIFKHLRRYFSMPKDDK